MTSKINQIEWDQSFMKAAYIFAENSKCAAKRVACILVKDSAIISIGVNGTLAGHPNCNDIYKKENGIWYKKSNEKLIRCEDQEEHHKWSKKNEVHAEINALAKAAKSGISTLNATAYITLSPCNNCIMALLSFGINRIVYGELYTCEDDALDKCLKSNVKIEKLLKTRMVNSSLGKFQCSKPYMSSVILDTDSITLKISNITIEPGYDGFLDGTIFLKMYLIPFIKDALKTNKQIIIDLDGCLGYPSTFIRDSFHQLRKYFSKNDLNKFKYISMDQPGLLDSIIYFNNI